MGNIYFKKSDAAAIFLMKKFLKNISFFKLISFYLLFTVNISYCYIPDIC